MVKSQGGVPLLLIPSAYMDATGIVVLGQHPPSGTIYLSSSTAGAGITITCSANCLTGTAAGDTGRWFTFSDGTCCGTAKTFVVTGNSGSSATVAQGTLETTLTTACTSGSPCSTAGASGIFESGPVYTATNTAIAGGTNCFYDGKCSVPLDVIHPSLFGYLPASAPPGVAGFYYCTMSAPNLAMLQCYNNVLPGTATPVIPSPTAFSGLTPAAFTQSTGAITALTLSLPGNSLGLNGELDVDETLIVNNTADVRTFAVEYNSTTVSTGNFTTSIASNLDMRMINSGATGAQTTGSIYTTSTGVSSAVLYSTVDSTTAQGVLLTMALQATSPGPSDWAMIARYSERLYRN
jgi:hypothetical protein